MQQCLQKTNFSTTLEAWQETADNLGYETVSDMIYCLWEERDWGVSSFDTRLGFCLDNNKIAALGLKKRKKGGANFTKNQSGTFVVICSDKHKRIFKSTVTIDGKFKSIRCTHCGEIIEKKELANFETRKIIKKHTCYNYLGYGKNHICIEKTLCPEKITKLVLAAKKLGYETASDALYILYSENKLLPRIIRQKLNIDFALEPYIRSLVMQLWHNRRGPKTNSSGRFCFIGYDGKRRKYRARKVKENLRKYKDIYCMNCKKELLNKYKWYERKDIVKKLKTHIC